MWTSESAEPALYDCTILFIDVFDSHVRRYLSKLGLSVGIVVQDFGVHHLVPLLIATLIQPIHVLWHTTQFWQIDVAGDRTRWVLWLWHILDWVIFVPRQAKYYYSCFLLYTEQQLSSPPMVCIQAGAYERPLIRSWYKWAHQSYWTLTSCLNWSDRQSGSQTLKALLCICNT